MATERKDGRWQARITTGKTSEGKPIKMFFYASSEEEAEKLASDYYEKYVIGNYSTVTFRDYSLKYLEYRRSELSVRTYEYYQSLLKLHVLPSFGGIMINEIKPTEIKNLLFSMEHKGVGAKTRVNTYLLLHLVFKEAVLDGAIEFNPVANVRKPKYKRKEMTTIPADHFWALFDIADQRMKLILYLTWCTGLRVGEVAGLQWGDVDFKNKCLHIRRAISKTNDGLILKSPKTSYGVRTISVPLQLLEMLKVIRGDSLFVFTNIYGQMQDPGTISKQFSKLCKKLGFSYHFHQLRHTHATILGDAGVMPKHIQERIGHGSAAFSLDVYTHRTEKGQDPIGEIEAFKLKIKT